MTLPSTPALSATLRSGRGRGAAAPPTPASGATGSPRYPVTWIWPLLSTAQPVVYETFVALYRDGHLDEVGIGHCFVCSYERTSQVAEEIATDIRIRRAIEWSD